MRLLILLILQFLIATTAAAISLDSLPAIPDNSLCDLGKNGYMSRAGLLARESHLPSPKTYPEFWSILTDYMLDACSDGQQLIVVDIDSTPEFRLSANKLLSRVCTESDIHIAKAPEIGQFATKLTCRVSKLNQLRVALNRQPTTVSRTRPASIGQTPEQNAAKLLPFEPSAQIPTNAPIEYIKKEFYDTQSGGAVGGLATLLNVNPIPPIEHGVVTWSAYINETNYSQFEIPAFKLKRYCESQKGYQWNILKPYDYDKVLTQTLLYEIQMLAYQRMANIGYSILSDRSIASKILLQSFDDVVFDKARTNTEQYPVWVMYLARKTFGLYQCSLSSDNYWFAVLMPGSLGSLTSRTLNLQVFIQIIPKPLFAN